MLKLSHKGVRIGLVVLIILILATLALVGYSAYDKSKSDKEVKETNSNSSNSQSNAQDIPSEVKEFRDLAVNGKDKKCTHTRGDIKSVTYFTSDNRKRVESEKTSDGTKTGGSLLLGDTQYVWSYVTKNGIKTVQKVNSNDSDKAQQPTSSGQISPQTGEATQPSISCEDWKVDEALFNPPNDIKFKDLSQAIPPSQ